MLIYILFIDITKTSIQIQKRCSTNINQDYPIENEENYTCANNQVSHSSIAIKNSRISIDVTDIYNIEAHEIQIDDIVIEETNKTDACSKSM